MNAQRLRRRGLFSIGGIALLLALPGAALAQGEPATGTSQPGTAGSTTPGTPQQGTGTGTNPTQPSTVPSPGSTSSFGMGVDAQGEGLTLPQQGEDDGTGLYGGTSGTGLYGGTSGTGGVDLGVGGSEEPPASLVPTPSTENNGVLEGTGGSPIPGMDESVPPQVELPRVPSADDAMGTQEQ